MYTTQNISAVHGITIEKQIYKIIRLYCHFVHLWFLLVILTSKQLYRYKFLRDVIFKVLWSTLCLWNFRPQHFIFKTFSSHQLESRILVNTCIWHLQGMMTSFYFISCSSWSSCENGAILLKLTIFKNFSEFSQACL